MSTYAWPSFRSFKNQNKLKLKTQNSGISMRGGSWTVRHFPIYLLSDLSLSLFKLGKGKRPGREPPHMLVGPPRGDDAKNSQSCLEGLILH